MAEAPAALDPRVVEAVTPALAGAGPIVTPSRGVAQALTAVGVSARVASLEDPDTGGCAGVALLADELSLAGEHAEGVLDHVVATVRPGGLVAVTARGALAAGPGRGFRGDELRRVLGHHGIAVELLCAPGAAAVAGGTAGAYDTERDHWPGVLDTGERLVAVGRAAGSADQRTDVFFRTLPRKVIAAAVLCRDAHSRVLVVHDSFKQHWTLPGGVVDADEDPRSAAVREAWEEAGVRVEAGVVLGVFAASWPDRLALVYGAWPREGAEHSTGPVHAHEIDAVAWWSLDEALRRLAPRIAEQVRHCIDQPGGTLRQRSR